jgi:hypothetical protein
VLQWNELVYFMTIWSTIWYILWPFGIFMIFLVHCPRFGMLHQEKSGNPAHDYVCASLLLASASG